MRDFITAKEAQERRFDDIREILNHEIMEATLMGRNQLTVWRGEGSSNAGNLYSPTVGQALSDSDKIKEELLAAGFTLGGGYNCTTILWEDN